jgi:hypothetical protein
MPYGLSRASLSFLPAGRWLAPLESQPGVAVLLFKPASDTLFSPSDATGSSLQARKTMVAKQAALKPKDLT